MLNPFLEILKRIRLAMHAPNRFRRVMDYLIARFLRRLPVAWRRTLFAGDQCFCPICESRLRAFIILNRPYHRWCPVCWSLQRHRFIWIFFQKLVIPSLPSERQSKMLHIAPEPALEAIFSKMPQIDYLSADLFNTRAMMQMDICDIQMPAESFDLIYCSHVLEHVHDDRQALKEFYRVLRLEGQSVIVVPITVQQTFEDPSITDPLERERLFGQFDHVRRYGLDFQDRLEEAGFSVHTFRRADLAGDDDVERMGLYPNEIVFLCRKPLPV